MPILTLNELEVMGNRVPSSDVRRLFDGLSLLGIRLGAEGGQRLVDLV